MFESSLSLSRFPPPSFLLEPTCSVFCAFASPLPPMNHEYARSPLLQVQKVVEQRERDVARWAKKGEDDDSDDDMIEKPRKVTQSCWAPKIGRYAF